MQLEDNTVTLSIHYRRAHDPAAAEALAAPLRALAEAEGLAFFAGKRVFEVRPPLEINKGTAFTRLVHEHRLDAAIFMGDDTTDADALRAARDLRAAGICDTLALGVASDDTPAAVRDSADVLVQGVSGVEDFLDDLLRARWASSS
jgi:trehalose 6-phosphate phosphatase